MEQIGDIVRRHRRVGGLSRVKLAKIAGVGKTAVFDLEHRKPSIRYDTFLKILQALNISVHFDSPLMWHGHAETDGGEQAAPWKKAAIFQQEVLAGTLEEFSGGRWHFRYETGYVGQPVSLTIPIALTTYEFDRFPPCPRPKWRSHPRG